MSSLTPTRSGHKPRLCKCEECGETGRLFTYKQWRWHESQRQHSRVPGQLSPYRPGSQGATSATATATLFASPVEYFLSQVGRSRRDNCSEGERRKRRRLEGNLSASGDSEDHVALPTLRAHAVDTSDPDRDADDSESDTSDTLPPFPDLPTEVSSIDSNDNASDGAIETDAASPSQASRLALARASLLDPSTSMVADIDQQTMEEAINDPLLMQRSRFVMVNYIFVMYLMTFHGLSNTIATLYLFFALHVLSRFSPFAVNPETTASTVGAPGASSSSSTLSTSQLPPPSPPPQSELASLSQPLSGSSCSATDPTHGTGAVLSSSQPAPLPPPPLSMLVTPASVRQRLGLQSDFDQYLVCPDCGELTLWADVEPHRPRQVHCSCEAKLLHDHSQRPIQLYCHRKLESIFCDVLMDPKYYGSLKDWMLVLEEASAPMDASNATAPNHPPADPINRHGVARPRTVTHRRRYNEVVTGSAWLEDCDHGAEDCRGQCHHDHTPFVAAGLNLKVTLLVDWFGPQKGKFHEWHSTGAILLRIDNLPAQLTTHDRRCLGTHLVGLLPGPRESSAARLQSFLTLIVDELLEFDLRGKVLKTHGHPEGELIKARLNMVVANTPARAKVAGFALKYKKGTICAYCPKQGEKLGLTDVEDEGGSMIGRMHRRTMETRTAAGFRPVAIDRLPYFNAVDSCPPDIMHAVHLGLCKRFWHRFLIEHCNDIGKRLPEAQSVIANALLPTSVQGPNKQIGSKSGGNPTAEQWDVLFRVLLPFVLMQLWTTSLSGNNNEKLTFSLFTRGGTDYAQPGGDADVTLDIDADEGTTGPRAADNAGLRPLLPGNKRVRKVFRSAMLLCSIVDLVNGDLDGDELDRLDKYINRYNRSQSQLLGPGWLTFNNHNVTHLPLFVRRFGSPRHFSSLPFERYNGIMGTIPTSGHKGGMLESTIMRNCTQRLGLRRLLAASNEPFFKIRLLASVEGLHVSDPSTLNTRLKKRFMENETFELLLSHLNRRTPASAEAPLASAALPTSAASTNPVALRFTPFWDSTAPINVVRLDKSAEFIRTATLDRGHGAVKVGGVGQGGRENKTNCWCLVSLDGVLRPAKILWIFSKMVRDSPTALDTTKQCFLHIRLLREVSLDVLGRRHPCLDLIRDMGIRLAVDSGYDDGEELVIDLESFDLQLAVVPFSASG
ncbi:uncharacterized protein UTRI_01791 [Ustilago trichophora]|uniref:Uncharacterized protein n=1 Tax=Ustilago trichophora TaxID=86804 RepID=A0A5C3DXE2_9BASI|nr:uncharacterized protein UTRI_01791 [Ustilago trichophora]